MDADAVDLEKGTPASEATRAPSLLGPLRDHILAQGLSRTRCEGGHRRSAGCWYPAPPMGVAIWSPPGRTERGKRLLTAVERTSQWPGEEPAGTDVSGQG